MPLSLITVQSCHIIGTEEVLLKCLINKTKPSSSSPAGSLFCKVSVHAFVQVSTLVCMSLAWSCVCRSEDNFSESVLSCYSCPQAVHSRLAGLRAAGRLSWLCFPHCWAFSSPLFWLNYFLKLFALRRCQVQVPQAVRVCTPIPQGHTETPVIFHSNIPSSEQHSLAS